MPRILIDNTPPSYVFQDGNQLTDGMANLAQALVQAPIAVANIRRQKQQEDMAQLWRQKQDDRQMQQDQLAQLWHDQGTQRQQALDVQQTRQLGIQNNLAQRAGWRADDLAKANTANLAADNARADKALWINGVAQLFKGAGGVKAGEHPTAATLKAAHELADAEALNRGVVEYDELGKRQIKDPKAWNTILRDSYALHGVKVPDSWLVPTATGTPAPAAGGTPATGTPGAAVGQAFGSTDELLQAARNLPPGDYSEASPSGTGPLTPEEIRGASDRRKTVTEGALPAAINTLNSRTLNPEQARILAQHIQAAQQGDHRAVRDLNEWYASQPDVQRRERGDKLLTRQLFSSAFGGM